MHAADRVTRALPGSAGSSALNWTYETAFAVVALAGLIGAIMVLAGRLRRQAPA